MHSESVAASTLVVWSEPGQTPRQASASSDWWASAIRSTGAERVVFVGEEVPKALEDFGITVHWHDTLDSDWADDDTHRSRLIWMLRADIALPARWAERLQRALTSHSKLACVSALSQREEFFPIPAGSHLKTKMGADAFDALVFACGDRRVVDTASINCDCALLRGEAIAGTALSQLPKNWKHRGLRTGALDHLWVGDLNEPIVHDIPEEHPDHRLPAPALATLQRRILAAGGDANPSEDRPGLDGRPVQLHIVHSWGGGIARWCDDYARADDERNQLFLVSRGDPFALRHGQFLELRLGFLDGPIVRQWDLSPWVESVDIENVAYRAILDEVLVTFAVDGVVVSSLVGHSIDALRLALPTLVVMHDYFPAWPLLDEWFERGEHRYDIDYLGARLGEAHGKNLLDDKRADDWMNVRAAWLKAVSREGVSLVAPNESVVNNLQNLGPEYALLDVAIVPHGSKPLARLSDPGDRRLRVVVTGRQSDAKGMSLLIDALEGLSQYADVYLVGCGRAGNAFLGRAGVHIVFDYPHPELRETMAEIAPHVGLLLSQVSETWSYTLTELWDLGILPVATRAGSLATRIQNDLNGLLIEPAPAALVDVIKTLSHDRDTLSRLRASLPSGSHDSAEHMVSRYHRLMPLSAGAIAEYEPRTLDGEAIAIATVGEALRREHLAHARAKALLKEQSRELSARASWGVGLQREVEQRTEWAKDLARQLDQEQTQARAILDAKAATETELGEVVERLRNNQAELDDRTRWAQSLDHTVELMRGSRSWKITKPLRYAARLGRQAQPIVASRWRRLRYVSGRVRNSVRTRGLKDTLTRIRGELARERMDDLALNTLPIVEDHGQSISFEPTPNPMASIIIPVFNHWHHTRMCLLSLLACPQSRSFEVIVVDDASSDETADRLAQCQGVTTVAQTSNQGFVAACNAGAQSARGQYLVFLNNDTTVTSDWLDALLATFDDHANVGLVGAQLVYPDGRLQEAGGVIFSDGSGWNYGRFDDPDHPAYQYVREVDYCSGAAIAIERENFDALGRFESAYAPAYYEDTDLAFKVRDAGQRVLYQPASRVVHHEGVTAGTDTTVGIKQNQVVNQDTFVQRWAAALASHPTPGTEIDVAKEHRVRGRVLMIDATVPSPDKDSGSVRLVNLMRLLIEQGWKVTFFAHNRAQPQPYTQRLQALGVEVWYAPWLAAPENLLATHGAHFDSVFVSRHYVAREYVRAIRRHCPRAKLIFDTVDLHYLREQRLAELQPSASLSRTAAATKLSELGVVGEADVTVVVGNYEADLLRQEVPRARVEVLSNIHHVIETVKPYADRKDIYFVGGYQHPPNVDAATWFVNEVWPLVQQSLPDARFYVVGSNAPSSVAALSGDGVEYVGYVPDLDPYLDGCRVAVAPLRYGAGVKGKINSAMAHGQPVVATTPAIEGMSLCPEKDVLIGDDPATFAACVVRLYDDEALWNNLSTASQDNVRKHFSTATAQEAVAAIFSN